MSRNQSLPQRHEGTRLKNLLGVFVSWWLEIFGFLGNDPILSEPVA